MIPLPKRPPSALIRDTEEARFVPNCQITAIPSIRSASPRPCGERGLLLGSVYSEKAGWYRGTVSLHSAKEKWSACQNRLLASWPPRPNTDKFSSPKTSSFILPASFFCSVTTGQQHGEPKHPIVWKRTRARTSSERAVPVQSSVEVTD